MKLRQSILTLALLTAVLLSLSFIHTGYAQDNLSLGCCLSPEGGGSCESCGEGGLKCAVDGSLCPETSGFTLGEVCGLSQVAGVAECFPAQSTGCCVDAENKCSDNVGMSACEGQHWFEGSACTDVPLCAAPPKDSLSIMQVLLIALSAVVIFSVFREFRRNRMRRGG